MGERAAEDRKVEGSSPSRGIFMSSNILFKLSFADSFTILNGIFGIFSIFFILNNIIRYSFIFILLSILADGIDGIIARKYGSYIGKYMDEFADTISFCIAPCIFSFHIYEIKMSLLFLFSSCFFIIFGMLHLINYHVSKKDYFIGLTTPASAIIIICISYLKLSFYILIPSFIILSVLMVLNIPYPRIEGKFAIFACIIIFIAMIKKEFAYLLLFSTLFYIIAGPFYIKHFRKA